MKKKLLLVLVSVLLISGCGKKDNIVVSYRDELEPGHQYDVIVTKKELEVVKTSFCSFVDCEPTVETLKTGLTKEEYEAIKKYHKTYCHDYVDLERFSILAYYIAKDNEVLATNADEDTWYYYVDVDKNKDGVVTYRENGLDMIENIYESER